MLHKKIMDLYSEKEIYKLGNSDILVLNKVNTAPWRANGSRD
jgi:hypothetical protein